MLDLSFRRSRHRSGGTGLGRNKGHFDVHIFSSADKKPFLGRFKRDCPLIKESLELQSEGPGFAGGISFFYHGAAAPNHWGDPDVDGRMILTHSLPAI